MQPVGTVGAVGKCSCSRQVQQVQQAQHAQHAQHVQYAQYVDTCRTSSKSRSSPRMSIDRRVFCVFCGAGASASPTSGHCSCAACRGAHALCAWRAHAARVPREHCREQDASSCAACADGLSRHVRGDVRTRSARRTPGSVSSQWNNKYEQWMVPDQRRTQHQRESLITRMCGTAFGECPGGRRCNHVIRL